MVGPRARVLVVDDEAEVRDMLARSLGADGFEVETADGGRAALEAARRRAFDLVITDLMMPGMDGAETAEALKAHDPSIEVIVGTGYATVETAVRCMKSGAYDYLEKPYDLRRLALTMDRALEKRQLQGAVALFEASRALLAARSQIEVTSLSVDLGRRVLRADEACLLLDGAALSDPLPPGAAEVLARELRAGAGAFILPSAARPLPMEFAEYGFVSALVLPLQFGVRSLGALVALRTSTPGSFTRAELQQGAVLAAQVALSLENARLNEEAAQRVDELVSTREQLVRAEKVSLAARLAGHVAHEINNPLSVVLANLGVLQESLGDRGLDGGDIGEILADIQDAVKRIAGLVTGFRRLTQTADRSAPRPVPIEPLLRRCVEAVSAESGSSVVLDVVGEPTVSTAEDDVRTAVVSVLSYLSRSHEGRPPSRSIAVFARQPPKGGHVLIDVTAPGLHLSHEERLEVLDPKVHGAVGGTMRMDLTMSLAWQLIRRNAGELTLVDSPGGGTSLRIALPVG